MLLNLEYGILIGIAVNIVYVLYSSARPKIEIEEVNTSFYLVKFKTGLHYTASEFLREHILQNCTAAKSTVIIDGEYIGNIDATVAKVCRCSIKLQIFYFSFSSVSNLFLKEDY